MIGVDTNILLRLYVADHPTQHKAAASFFSSRTEDEPAYIRLIVLVEFVWALRRTYGYSKDDIATLVARMVDAADIRLERAEIVTNALKASDGSAIGFVDAVIALANLADGCSITMTFDKTAARRIPGMELLA
jgi:predicted nucleic-acid-binding protein